MSFINKILPTSYLSEINYLIGEDRKKILYMGILFISISILDLIGIGIIGPYIALILDPTMADGLLSDIASFLSLHKGHSSLLISVGMLLISVFLLKLVLVLLAHKMIIKFSYQKMNNLREQLMSKYQSMPYNKYVQRSSSEYIYNIQTLTLQFTEDVLRPLLEIISSTLLVVSIFLLLAWLDPFALMIILSLMALMGLIYDRLTKNKMTAYGSKINIYSTLLIKGVQEGFDGLKEIRILNNESYFFNKVKVATRKYSNYKSKALVIVAIPRYLLETIMVVFLVLLVIFNIFGNKDMSSIFPTLAMFGLASFRLMPSVSSLLSGLLKLRHSRNSVSILFSDLSCIEGIDINKKIKHTASSLQFKSFSLNNVSYKYDSEKSMVLKSLSLVINSGECIGLIGSSGSGKTTLVDVILGLLRIKEGETLYNQEKMTKKLYNLWRDQIAYIPQNIFLIDDSLRNNIALGVKDSEINENKLKKSIEQAQLTKLVAQLNKGENTILGERGVRLSGGQRQRIALARAFYHDREVLVMDEATSALDNETEIEIIDEIQKLKRKKTIIIIAHRFSTLKHCDKIYEISDGRIIKEGTFNEMCR